MPAQPRGWGRTSARPGWNRLAAPGAHPGLEVAPGCAQPLQTGEEFQKLGFLPGTLARNPWRRPASRASSLSRRGGLRGIQAAAPGGEIGEGSRRLAA